MANPMQIFIGSSQEAQWELELIEGVIREASMEPVRWKDAFPVSKMLLETIERLPIDFHGAVLLATPDTSFSRGQETSWDPVSNISFEFGYLVARLTRTRVAICKFGKATLPSDLGGLKSVDFKEYDYENKPTELPKEPADELRGWLENIPLLAERISPVHQVHGYSGTWNVESNFSLWRGKSIQSDDKVYFEGKAFLVLQNDGERGSGIQVGKLYVRIGEYMATHEILNEIIAASVDATGTLKMLVKVVRREGPKDVRGKLDETEYPAALPNKEFSVEVHPEPGKPEGLTGTHSYKTATKIYQQAVEHWEYVHLIGSSCL